MILICDGSSFLYRACFSLSKGGTSTPNYKEISRKFLGLLYNELQDWFSSIKRFYVLWDEGGSHRRTQLHPEYKQNRDKSHLALLFLKEARNFLHKYLQEKGVYSIRIPGIEADDIAYFLTYYLSEGLLVTEDHDWYLNLRKNWQIFHPREKKIFTYYDLCQLVGHRENPHKVYLYAKAMVGDIGDNIPGIPGIGWKSAIPIAKLLVENQPLLENSRTKKFEEQKNIFERNIQIMDHSWILKMESLKIFISEEFQKKPFLLHTLSDKDFLEL